jgi:lysophospholipase L1-like esterase
MIAGAALVAGSLILAFVILEIGLRLSDGVPVLTTINFVGSELDRLHKEASPFALVYDPHLGWVMRPDFVVERSGAVVTTGPYGVRMPSAQREPLQQGSILVVGDSFGAGAEVADAAAWPAQLQALIGTQVINAAVGGYGLDQSMLRAEELAPLLEPRLLLLQTRLEYGNSLDRMSVAGGTPKPYFTAESGALVLHNEPVPQIADGNHDLGWQRAVFGHSYLVQYVMTRLDLLQWWVAAVRTRYELSEREALDVGCLLMRRLADFRDHNHVRVALVVQYAALEVKTQSAGWERDHARVLGCAREQSIEVVDTRPALTAVADNPDPAVYRRLWVMQDSDRIYGHPSAAGNRVIARQVARQVFDKTLSEGRP